MKIWLHREAHGVVFCGGTAIHTNHADGRTGIVLRRDDEPGGDRLEGMRRTCNQIGYAIDLRESW